MATAQAVFQSNVNGGTGRWNEASSWILIGGVDSNNVPDANDEVIILEGDRVDIRNNEEVSKLTIAGTLNYNRNRRLSVLGDLTISGRGEVTGNGGNRILEVLGDFYIPSGANANLNGQTYAITGTTRVEGTLNFLSSAGNKAFGTILIYEGGNWNNTTVEDFIVNGSLQNDGVFRGCTDVNSCEYTFTAKEATLSGTNMIVIPDLTVEESAVLTNLTSLVVNDQLTGDGTFINGINSRLELQTGGPFNVDNFEASATPNTVVYTRFGSAALFETTYHDLIIDKSSGTIENNQNIIINNDLIVIEGNFEVSDELEVLGQVLITGGRLRVQERLTIANDVRVEGGEFEPNSSNAEISIGGNLLLSSGEFDQNGGEVNVEESYLATGGNFIMTGGSVTISNNYQIAGGVHDLNRGRFSTQDLNVEEEQEVMIGNVTFTHRGNSSINGTVRVDAAEGLNTFNDITINPGGIWDVGVAARFQVDGSIAHNGSEWTLCVFNRCEYTFTNSNALLTGSSIINFSDVVVEAGSSLSNLTEIRISNRLAGAGTFINGENALLTYAGNNFSEPNFSIAQFDAAAEGNTVRFNRRNGRQRLRPTVDGTYFNVIIDIVEFGDVELNAEDITIRNAISLIRGDVVLNNRRLIISEQARIIGGGSDSYININDTGVLRQLYDQLGETRMFPIGDRNDFSPINSFTLTAGQLQPEAFVDFHITDQAHPDRDRSNIDEGGNDEGIRATAFISRFWTLTGGGITDERFDVVYQYVDNDVIGTESDMVGALYRFIPQLGIFDWLPRGIVSPGQNTVRFMNADGFGDLTAMDDALTRLPITLVSFDAEVSGEGNVLINWATASEENNALFTIERSENGIDFEPILFLDGSGDSNELIRYMLTDNMPPSGRVFYRLKQTDFNGLFSRSQIVSIRVPESTLSPSEPLFRLHGNPVSQGESTIIARSLRGEAVVAISDLKGNEVYRHTIGPTAPAEVAILMDQRFASGIYLITVWQEGRREVKRLLVQ